MGRWREIASGLEWASSRRETVLPQVSMDFYMAYYTYYTFFFKDRRIFTFSDLYSEPFPTVQDLPKRQGIIYLQIPTQLPARPPYAGSLDTRRDFSPNSIKDKRYSCS